MYLFVTMDPVRASGLGLTLRITESLGLFLLNMFGGDSDIIDRGELKDDIVWLKEVFFRLEVVAPKLGITFYTVYLKRLPG
jgi:hypothetical protein